MRKVVVAATQMSCTWDREATLAKAEKLVREAAAKGANIILLQELFETPYFCQRHDFEYMDLATTPEENPAVKRFQKVAKELDVVIPVSFFERAGNAAFNSIAIIDADGTVLGKYRKTHIPDGMPYAEILFYPTAIGSEPVLQTDSKPHWQRCMQGHAAANIMPVVASNRIGHEVQKDSEMTFYGSSFIADETGGLVAEADRETEGVITAEFDLDAIAQKRREWGVFRDRRPEMYGTLLTHGC